MANEPSLASSVEPLAARATPPARSLPLPFAWAAVGAVLSGALYFVAFAGMDVWPLAFVSFVPLWIALLHQPPRRAFAIGLIAGATMNVAGFSWLLEMLRTFSGFSTPICAFFMVLVCIYQGGRIGLLGWLYARAAQRGWPGALVLVAAFVASELFFPLLFPWSYAATVHQVPYLIQTAELGGPVLVGAILVAANVALAEPIVARLERRRLRPLTVTAALLPLAAGLLFARIRIGAVDRAAAAAPAVHVGVVQGNMGLMEKREDPSEGLRRHQRLTLEMRAQRQIDMVVWSESSVTFAVREDLASRFMHDRVAGQLGVPAIFGAVVYRRGEGRDHWYNTSFSTDAAGQITARYNKEFLLAFGEYLPFGRVFPILYDWSPNSGRFSPGADIEPAFVGLKFSAFGDLFLRSKGNELDPLLVSIGGTTHKISALICYEDILPDFTNRAVVHADPELLVNITNDAWFGDSLEPWQHLALSTLRAVEHRRYLVRSNNSGVSAFIDPVGRVIAKTGTFRTETLDATVHWMRGRTVYERVGDVPWDLASAALVAACFVRRRRPDAAIMGAA
jgi:apolipoprotein N-acyltransferase